MSLAKNAKGAWFKRIKNMKKFLKMYLIYFKNIQSKKFEEIHVHDEISRKNYELLGLIVLVISTLNIYYYYTILLLLYKNRIEVESLHFVAIYKIESHRFNSL